MHSKKMSKNNAKLKLFFTEKHASHDKIWMFQDSSSNSVCFACAVETLDDITSLNVRKRRMVSDMMELLTTNRSIWEILTRQKATLCHTGNVLLNLLSSKDKQLSALVVETLGILVQKSREDNAISLLQSLTNVLHSKRETMQLENMAPYFCFLGKILRRSGSTVKALLTDHQWLFEMLIENVGEIPEGQAISYWYILAQVYKSEHSRHVNIGNSKLVIEKVVSVLVRSVSKDLQLNILSVFMSFAKNRLLHELIMDDDNESSSSQNSIANMMKKLMLSTSLDIQRISVQCLTEVLKISSAHDSEKSKHFSQILMAKGLCEFLFELLGSSEQSLTATVLNCLQCFADVNMFFTAGHVLYGIESIVDSLGRAITGRDRFIMYPALHLLLKILQNIKNTASIEKQVSCLLEMITQLSGAQDTSILNLAISCATEILVNSNSGQFNSVTVMTVVERFGKRLSKKSASALGNNFADPDTMNLLKNTLNFVRSTLRVLERGKLHGINRNMNEPDICATQPSGTYEQHLQELQRGADMYLIPSTVILLPFVKEPETFNSFFEILATLLGNSEDGALAKKLCESSFIRIALEVKAGLMREDRSNNIGALIDNFLVLLACKLDDGRDDIGLDCTLSEILSFLQTAPGEWHLFFNKASSNLDMNIVHPIRLACISLVYVSVRFGDPLWKSDVILRCITNCMKDDNPFYDVPCSLKRHLIYLWAHARSHTNTNDSEVLCTDKQITSLIEKEPTPSNLFIPERCFVDWIIGSATELRTKAWALSELFSLDKNSTNTPFENTLKSLASYRNSHEFYEICAEILASGESSVVRNALGVVASVLGDGKNFELLSGIKVIINRILLSHGSELHDFNLLALLEFYRYLMQSHVSTISDIDLKLASRLCSLFLEFSITDIRVAVLNSLNQFLFHIQNNDSSSQAAVVCNEMFLKEVYGFISRQMTFNGSKCELLVSACLVFLSQLLATISSQTFPTASIQPIIVKKEALILSLARSDLPVIQLACLHFWNCFLTLAPAHAYLFQGEEEPLHLCEDDLEAILIYSQNLLLNDEPLIREQSMKVLIQVTETLKSKNSDFHSPWNRFILQHLLDALAPDSDLEFKIKMIKFLINDDSHLKNTIAIVPPVMALINSGLQETSIEAIKALLQIMCILAKDVELSAQQITDINKCLHSLEDHARGLIPEKETLKETTRPLFVVYRDVLFPVCNKDYITIHKYLDTITECKDIIDKQQRYQ